MVEAAVALHLAAHEGEGLLGRRQLSRLIERERRLRKGGDHQAVPVGQDLVVPSRADAGGTRRQQYFAAGGEPSIGGAVGRWSAGARKKVGEGQRLSVGEALGGRAV